MLKEIQQCLATLKRKYFEKFIWGIMNWPRNNSFQLILFSMYARMYKWITQFTIKLNILKVYYNT
jgi:hypothetical protein